jgi:hypothetical protein
MAAQHANAAVALAPPPGGQEVFLRVRTRRDRRVSRVVQSTRRATAWRS